MREGEPQAPAEGLTPGLSGVFEDLEQQAAGLHLAERDAELVDRARGEYATVSFASRVHASVGHEVRVNLVGGQVVQGRLAHAGIDWCVVAPSTARATWLVRLAAVAFAHGLSPRAVPEAARPVHARLGFGSALHRLAEEAAALRLHAVSGPVSWVRISRIGADFLEAEPVDGPRGSQSPLLVPFAALVAVESR